MLTASECQQAQRFSGLRRMMRTEGFKPEDYTDEQLSKLICVVLHFTSHHGASQ